MSKKIYETITYISQIQQSNYFKIKDIPQVFTKGINSFKLKVDKNLFKQNTNIDIQIIDCNGNKLPTKYYNVTINSYRLITIYITDEIQNGIGNLYISATLNDVPNN